jgi:acyl carrier protein
MTHDEIAATAIMALKRIAPDSDPASLAPDTDYRRALDLDSFDTLRFLTQISTDLGIDIPEADYGQVVTLGGLVEYADRQRRHNDAGRQKMPGVMPGDKRCRA